MYSLTTFKTVKPKMRARILFPSGNCTGNLLWSKQEIVDKTALVEKSLVQIRTIGYWASPYPEGDGVTFTDGKKRSASEIQVDFSKCFNWLDIAAGTTNNSNLELAELEPNVEMLCTVIVPLSKLKIEESFLLGIFRFVCRKECDLAPHERLGDFDCEYLEFQTQLRYQDLLRVNSSFTHNDQVINQCLALAENAMDLIRYQFSSFKRPQFTPNPAGQLDDGFYSIEIIPEVFTHLKPIVLSGISRPFSVSNNWLGPEVEEQTSPGLNYLIEILHGRNDELALSVKSALRACRQSFYALGDESKFLNMVFALDGMVGPGRWKGWKHRTYIAALLSGEQVSTFKSTLSHYDDLYEIRNRLVHGGADFFQIHNDPAKACQDLLSYIGCIVVLIEFKDFKTRDELRNFATRLLVRAEFNQAFTEHINSIEVLRAKEQRIPTWAL